MSDIKKFFAVSFGILGALILAPFVAFFGLMMLGLAFGLALVTAAAVTTSVRQAEAEAQAETVDATATKAGEATA